MLKSLARRRERSYISCLLSGMIFVTDTTQSKLSISPAEFCNWVTFARGRTVINSDTVTKISPRCLIISSKLSGFMSHNRALGCCNIHF